MDKKIKVNSEIEVTIHMIGGKYKPLILYILITKGSQRFTELKGYINSISQKTLTNQLRQLELDNLIKRTVYNAIPPHVEYSITKKGNSLFTILKFMCIWGLENTDDKYEIINSLNKNEC